MFLIFLLSGVNNFVLINYSPNTCTLQQKVQKTEKTLPVKGVRAQTNPQTQQKAIIK